MAKSYIPAGDTLVIEGTLSIETALILSRAETATSDNTASMGSVHTYAVTDTSAPRTLTISSADITDNRQFVIKDQSGLAGINNITIDTEGSEKIDGADTITISVNYGSATLYSDGSNLFSI